MASLRTVPNSEFAYSFFTRLLLRIYDRIILRKPRSVLCFVALLMAFAAIGIRDFRLDASADTLILEDDPDLRLFREVTERYATAAFLVIAFIPDQDLLADETLRTLSELHTELEQLELVTGVKSIVNVPLLQNPPVPLAEVRKNLKSVLSPGLDKALARQEFQENPVFRNLLVSPDLKATALMIMLQPDDEYEKVLKQRMLLLQRKAENNLSAQDQQQLQSLTERYDRLHARQNQQRHRVIQQVRLIMAGYRDDAQLHLGGVPMVADDMMTFIKRDLRIFGIGMFIFLVVTLGAIFRQLRWVLLPVVCCAVSVAVMMGLLGFFGWEVTVVSSNFISLQLIMTMALAIHIMVRYSELLGKHPVRSPHALMIETVRTIFTPCLYTTATTIAGFSSLVFCGILPVINFGWMMTAGLIVSLLVTFTILPAASMILPRLQPVKRHHLGAAMISALARFTRSQGVLIGAVSTGIIILTVIGAMQLEVENSFINYFRPSTEIYQGMAFIDRNLGGTTPLDILIQFPEDQSVEAPALAAVDEGSIDVFDEFAEFDDTAENEKYWFTPAKLELIGEVHRYLTTFPETGKALSVYTVVELVQWLSENADLDALDMALLFNELPQELRAFILDPYASPEHNEARISVRINDSMPSLRRRQLLSALQADLDYKFKELPETYQAAGMMVLYSNMLQSLFESQVETIGVTLLAIMLMFLALFRSLKISLIAIFPNLISCLSVLGVMGLAGLPLDMMTITIVAISIGIAVDNTIHYIHRFKHEYSIDYDYQAAMLRSHATIGHALSYTSVTIVVGFSILVFSNFVPTILFGLLTGLAITMALLSSLTLLPKMILILKPFPDASAQCDSALSELDRALPEVQKPIS